MRLALECMYCGHKWRDSVFTKQSVESKKCPICHDSHIKVKDINTDKVDYYAGSPPFPPKHVEFDHNPFADYVGGVDYGNTD